MAVAYTKTSAEVLASEIKERKDKEDELIEECEKIKKKLENTNIKFKVKTGNNGKVFGSISTKQISEELKNIGYDIDKKKIILNNDINTLGTHEVVINLHKKVSLKINVILEA